MEHVPSNSPPSTEKLREQAQHLRSDLHELGDAAREAAKEKLHEAGRVASEYADSKKEQLTGLEDELIDYVRAKPVRSVLVAAGIGALLGMFWSR